MRFTQFLHGRRVGKQRRVVEFHRFKPCACGCGQYCDIDLDAHDVWDDEMRELGWFRPECCPACQQENQ